MLRTAKILTTATRSLFFAGAVFWVAVAGALASGVTAGEPMPKAVSIGLGMAMVAGAVAMAFLGWRCLTGRPVIDAVAVIVATGNTVLTFTDQVGTLDLVYLAFAVTLLATLVSALVLRRTIKAQH